MGVFLAVTTEAVSSTVSELPLATVAPKVATLCQVGGGTTTFTLTTFTVGGLVPPAFGVTWAVRLVMVVVVVVVTVVITVAMLFVTKVTVFVTDWVTRLRAVCGALVVTVVTAASASLLVVTTVLVIVVTGALVSAVAFHSPQVARMAAQMMTINFFMFIL